MAPATGKRAKLDTTKSQQADPTEPVAGPSSGRRAGSGHDHAAKKRQALQNKDVMEGIDEDEDDEHVDDEDASGTSDGSDGSVSGAEDDEVEEDDYDDILQANEDAQTGKKKKRKRALPQEAFGSMLSSLIAAPAPTKALRPMHKPASAEALERRARKALQAQKHEREERGHVRDVIAGWAPRPNVPFSQWNKVAAADEKGSTSASIELTLGGAEKEKELRRLAQRGVVRLFNAIKAAQYTEESATAASSRTTAIKNDASASARLAIKAGSPAPSATGSVASGLAPVSREANVLGSRGKQEVLANLSRASFLDLFKAGSAAKPKVQA